MKNAILVILLFISSVSFGQFNLSSAVGFGIEVNSKLEYDLFQSTVTVEPGFQIDKFSIGSQSIALRSDSATKFFTGIKAGYNFWNEKNKSLSISLHGLLGTAGNKLIGGGLSYKVDDISLNADFSQEYLHKTFIGVLSVGYLLTK